MKNLPVETGNIQHHPQSYGQSIQGTPLNVYLPESGKPDVLIFASMHGDESLGTVLLSKAMRSIHPDEMKTAVILAQNPDGVLLGTRANANGVDLNRNFPTRNWSPDPVHYRSRSGQAQDIPLSPGATAGSEAETRALMKLVDQLGVGMIVSVHGFLGCIDDPQATAMAQTLAELSDLELVPDVGYATPGSFGSWCAEKGIDIITYELPSAGDAELQKVHLPIFVRILKGEIAP